MAFGRKLQRSQQHLSGAEAESRCDLLEAWLRRHAEQSPCPPPQLMGWLTELVKEGYPGMSFETFARRWPQVAEVVLLMANAVMDLHETAPEQVDCKIALSHMLSYSVGSSMWTESGYPTVRCDGELGAALMLTDSSGATLEPQLPWKAFLIHVPPDTLHYRYQGKEPTPVESLLVSYSGDVFMVTLVGPEPSMPFSIAWGSSLEELLRSRDTWTQHAIVAELAVNLVRGVLLQIQAGRLTRVKAQKPASGHRWRRPGELPATQDFVLGTPIREGRDYLGAVRSIARGTQRYGKVQWLVRGHQRWQACGPRHTERKLIWVEPFWKGPVDAPVRVREHVLGEEERSP